MEGEHEAAMDQALCFAAMEVLGRAVLITDERGIILYINRAFTDITGFAPAETVGKTTSMLRSGRQSREFYRRMWQDIEEQGEWEGMLWNRRKDGGFYHERLNIRRMAMPAGVRYVGVFSDISEQDKLQRALIDAQKRELMATLTGGIAHNFNNYLAAIQGFAQLGHRVAKDPKVGRYFSEIRGAADKASALVKKMLKISHPDPSLDHPFDFAATVHQAVHTAQSLLPGHIEFVTDLPEQRSPIIVMGNQSDIEQTVLNLVTNARDALEGRKDAQIRVRMKTKAGACPENCPCISSCAMHRGHRVMLKVEDNGCGIPETIRDSIFDPFFTTKGYHGTGLGLASVHQIVNRLGGTIWIEPMRRAGTAFHICLPQLSDVEREHAGASYGT